MAARRNQKYLPQGRTSQAQCSFVIIIKLSRSISNEAFPLKNTSLQAKLDYWAKVRRSNYAASMRLEGYPATPADAKRELPSRETVLRAYRKPA